MDKLIDEIDCALRNCHLSPATSKPVAIGATQTTTPEPKETLLINTLKGVGESQQKESQADNATLPLPLAPEAIQFASSACARVSEVDDSIHTEEWDATNCTAANLVLPVACKPLTSKPEWSFLEPKETLIENSLIVPTSDLAACNDLPCTLISGVSLSRTTTPDWSFPYPNVPDVESAKLEVNVTAVPQPQLKESKQEEKENYADPSFIATVTAPPAPSASEPDWSFWLPNLEKLSLPLPASLRDDAPSSPIPQPTKKNKKRNRHRSEHRKWKKARWHGVSILDHVKDEEEVKTTKTDDQTTITKEFKSEDETTKPTTKPPTSDVAETSVECRDNSADDCADEAVDFGFTPVNLNDTSTNTEDSNITVTPASINDTSNTSQLATCVIL